MSAVRMVPAILLTATALLVAAPTALAGSHAPAFDRASLMCAFDDLEGQVEVSDRLQVNARRSSRILAPNKCQEEGERELRELAASQLSEEAYAFVPSLCTWIETSYHETERSVRLDKALVEQLVDVIKTFPCTTSMRDLRKESLIIYRPTRTCSSSCSLPGNSWMTPLVSDRHRVITVRGTFDYSFVVSDEARSLVEVMKASGLVDTVSQNLAYEYTRGGHRTKYYDAVRECGRQAGSQEDDMTSCFPMQAGDFILEFSEFHR